MGWFGFQLELFADALCSLLYGRTSAAFAHSLFLLFGGRLMITPSVIGFRALDWLEQLATPLLLIVLGWPIANHYLTHGGFEFLPLEIAEKDRLSFGSALSMVLSGSALGLLIT